MPPVIKQMNSETATIHILGTQLYTYGLYLSLACFSAAIFLLFRSQKSDSYKNAAALTCLLSPIFGLILARLVFVLFEVNFSPFLSFKNAIDLKTGGFSMFGTLTGAVLGAMLAAKASKIKTWAWLDQIIPALFIFITIARLGEAYTSLGISRPLVTDVLKNTFLAFQDEYDAYLRTYLLESFTAAILFFSSLIYSRRHKIPGQTFVFGCLLFAVTQTLFESLRFDAHIRFSFVGLQQVLSIVLFSLILVFLSIRLLVQKRNTVLATMALILLPFVLGAILGIEFMIDRSSMSKWLSYAMYIIVLLIPSLLGLALLQKERV